MNKIYQQIIEKFNINIEELQDYGYNSKNEELINKLQDAYDFFIENISKKNKNILFTQFVQNLKNFITKNKNRRTQSDQHVPQKYSFAFILLKPDQEQIVMTQSPDSSFFNFFYTVGDKVSKVFEQFQTYFNSVFKSNINQNQFFQFIDHNNKNDSVKVCFVHILNNQLDKEFIQRNNAINGHKLYEIDIHEIKYLQEPKMMIAKNYEKIINSYMRSNNFKKDRKFSLSTPVKYNQQNNLDKNQKMNAELFVQQSIDNLSKDLDLLMEKFNFQQFNIYT